MFVVVGDRRGIQPVGIRPQKLAALSELGAQEIARHLCELSDGVNAELRQLFFGGVSHKQQGTDRKRPDRRAVVVRMNLRDRIGLFEIRAELGEDLVPAHADGHRDAQLALDAGADLLCNLRPASEQRRRSGDIQPGLVDAEALNLVGIIGKNLFHPAGKFVIERKIRRNNHKLRTFPPCLPQRLGSRHAVLFREIIFRQNDSVPAFFTAADRHRHLPRLRPVQHFNRRVKAVAVGMQDASLHIQSLL